MNNQSAESDEIETIVPLGEGEGLLPTLRAAALSHGATEIGVCSADPFPDVRDSIAQRVAAGLNGPLKLTYGDGDLATDIRRTHPWAVSLVVLGLPYLAAFEAKPPAGAGEIARFATEDHYLALGAALDEVSELLRQTGFQAEAVFDDNSLVDRAAAQRAGVGWWGRNTMMIAPGVGPWMLLGSVVTDAPLSVSTPMSRNCGTCFDCLPACPTGALDNPGVLDARKCLATWLQARALAPLHLRAKIGARVYGCDDCLTACPPGARYLGGQHDPGGYEPSEAGQLRFDLVAALATTDQDLMERFAHLYVPKREGRYLRRNIIVALGNTATTIEHVEGELGSGSSVVRSAAAWAIGQISSERSAETLRVFVDGEGVKEVVQEAYLALMHVEFPQTYGFLLEFFRAAWQAGYVSDLALIGSHAVGEGNAASDLDLQITGENIESHLTELGVPDSAARRAVEGAVIWSWTSAEGVRVDLAVTVQSEVTELNSVQRKIFERGVVVLLDKAGRLERIQRELL